jgi:hypothetical protein
VDCSGNCGCSGHQDRASSVSITSGPHDEIANKDGHCENALECPVKIGEFREATPKGSIS